MMEVTKYMKEKVPMVTLDLNFSQIVKKMVEERTNSLIVVDSLKNKKPLGVISSLSLIRKIVPDFFGKNPIVSSFDRKGQLVCYVLNAKNKDAKSLMMPLKKTLELKDAMIEAASFMSKGKVRILPVVDEQGRVCGIIDRTCIKQAIYDALFNSQDEDISHCNP